MRHPLRFVLLSAGPDVGKVLKTMCVCVCVCVCMSARSSSSDLPARVLSPSRIAITVHNGDNYTASPHKSNHITSAHRRYETPPMAGFRDIQGNGTESHTFYHPRIHTCWPHVWLINDCGERNRNSISYKGWIYSPVWERSKLQKFCASARIFFKAQNSHLLLSEIEQHTVCLAADWFFWPDSSLKFLRNNVCFCRPNLTSVGILCYYFRTGTFVISVIISC